MKADTRSGAEKEALEWTTEALRCVPKIVMTREGGRQAMQDYWIKLLLDLPHHHPMVQAATRCALFEGDKMFTNVLRVVACRALERGIPLTNALEAFVMCFLAAPDMKWKPGKGDTKEGMVTIDLTVEGNKRSPGQNAADFYYRDYIVITTMEMIVERWSFPATRRDQARPSAASIVVTAIDNAIGLGLSEAAINKIWNSRKAFKLPEPSETISAIK